MAALDPDAELAALRAFFEGSASPACIAARDGAGASLNPAWASLLGDEVGWLFGTGAPSRFVEDDRQAVAEALASLTAGRPVDFEGRVAVADDGRRALRFSVWTDGARLYASAREHGDSEAAAVATVAHELRTPLTAVRGALSLLAESALAPDEAHLVQIASANAERLARIAADLLELERLGLGVLRLDRQPLQLSRVLADTVDSTRETARQHGATLALVADLDATVLGDAFRLVQALTNLVSNACKHSPAGGVVEVRLARARPTARIEVRDRGPGVPEAFRPRLFQRFAQAAAADAQRGAGLGLSLARAIVEAHGGRVGYQPAPGGGSCFFVELPVLG